MADIVTVTPSASYTVWAEDFASSGVVQRVKIVLGTVDADGGNVGTTNQMPISGTVAAIVPAGLSVSAIVSGTVSVSGQVQVSGVVSVSVLPAVSLANVVPVTTAASVSVTALPVWLNPTQPVVVNTIAAGFSVNALVTGVVSVSVLPAISIAVSAVLGTVITQLGTQIVTLATGATIATLLGVVSVDLGVSETIGTIIAVSGVTAVSAISTIVTILGTQVVSVVPGLSVSALVSVSALAASVVLGTIIAVSGITAVSAVSTIVTILGTQVVTIASMKFTTATPTVTETGPVFWLANTVTVTVTATVTGSLIISGVTPSTGAVPGSAVSVGIPVWPGILPVQPVMIVVTSTAIAQSAAAYLFTMWTGVVGPAAAVATTALAIAAGHTFRVINVQAVINSSAVTGGTVNVILLAAGATASMNSASISTQFQVIKLQALVSAGPIAASIVHGFADVGAGTTIGVFIVASTAAVLQQLAIMGYLF